VPIVPKTVPFVPAVPFFLAGRGWGIAEWGDSGYNAALSVGSRLPATGYRLIPVGPGADSASQCLIAECAIYPTEWDMRSRGEVRY